MDINFPKLEEKILKFWQDNGIFEKSLKKGKGARNFIFYEGPPTANGRPGIHHVEARTFKDIICRFKTMQGFRVARKAGWDTHGLPVELEVEKTLGLKSKKEIEEYGIAQFNQKCKESVWKYKTEWERLTERIAFWLDLKNPYITYQTSYIESVWWILKKIFQKGLFYQDYKVVPYCPRCGTSLSSHEVAQGYKKVKENAIYVKFPVKGEPNTYFLVWTTTPWTLPANVAIAVNSNIEYVKIRWQEEIYFGGEADKTKSAAIYYLAASKSKLFVSKDLANAGNILATMHGKDLLNKEYEPLYSFIKPEKKAHFIVAGDFVSAEDGTGLVHIAPAFGEDDMEVAKKNNLPVFMSVDEQGKFKLEIKLWAGMFVKTADPLIIENLKNRNLLFKEEMYEHDYPFCWRCSSPLLYYAKQSWFIGMRQVKKELIANNQKINWVPSHLKEGRFGEWLKDVKDWAVSRERYWGTPLPLWQCSACKSQEFIGSLEDLVSQNFSDNNYYLMRHGHSLRQLKKVSACWPEKTPYPLTEQGRKQAAKSAKELKKEKIDLIFSSDLLRTKETSWIVSKETGAKTILAKELREYNVGEFNGRDPKLVWDYLKTNDANPENFLLNRPKNGESLQDIADRMYQFLKSLNKQYKGKNILIVSHELPLTILAGILKGKHLQKVLEERREGKEKGLATAGWKKIAFADLPLNQESELDLHRPYIDEVEFACKKCRGKMKRIPEVLDCWFDSGAMPFAQQHYPFENKNLIDKRIQFPADYISEAIDQTRGWFYTLLAISTVLDLGTPYKNVISLGHVLDEKGEKMSKSKGNIVDPWYILDKYGADASRWYFYTVNQPGDPKLFSEKDVELALKKFLFTFWNSFVFFDTYKQAAKKSGKNKTIKSSSVLDKWILSKLNSLVAIVSYALEKYDVVSAARAIENFVSNDFSQWYIRRSRKRFHIQENDNASSKKDFKEAASILEFCLLETSKLSAPFIPFLSEEIFQRLGGGKSVHLTDWPTADKKMIDKDLEAAMGKTREIVSLALAERIKAGIKVRQPLKSLKIKAGKIKLEPGLLKLIQDEVNVKTAVLDNKIKTGTELDTEITKELKEEGMLREIFRNVQDIRKQSGFLPKDKIVLQLFGADEINAVFQKNKKMIIREARVQDLVVSDKKQKKAGAEKDLVIDSQKIYLAIKLV